jgi:hypothetical protein
MLLEPLRHLARILRRLRRKRLHVFRSLDFPQHRTAGIERVQFSGVPHWNVGVTGTVDRQDGHACGANLVRRGRVPQVNAEARPRIQEPDIPTGQNTGRQTPESWDSRSYATSSKVANAESATTARITRLHRQRFQQDRSPHGSAPSVETLDGATLEDPVCPGVHAADLLDSVVDEAAAASAVTAAVGCQHREAGAQ